MLYITQSYAVLLTLLSNFYKEPRHNLQIDLMPDKFLLNINLEGSMKIYQYAAIACLLFSTSSFASAKNDYNSGAYKDEGAIVVKFRGFFAQTAGKQKGLPTPTTASPVAQKHLLENGFGLENANTVFFTDHFAAELAIGVGAYNVSRTALGNVAANYGTGNGTAGKARLVALPLTFTMQLHVAPFGAIRPYAGAGYNGTYFFSRAKEYKVGIGHGVVFQVGADIVMTDDSLINIDIKKYSLSPKITYKSSFVGGTNSVSSKLKIDPWVFSFGLGFKL
mgnify:FL=1